MIVATYAGLLALVFMVLSVNVIVRRYQIHSSLGDNEDFELKRRIRAHANFIEYTPLFLILMGYAEFGGMDGRNVHILCSAFLLGRISHALSVLKLEKYRDGKIIGWPVFRTVGMVCSFTAIMIAAFTLIV